MPESSDSYLCAALFLCCAIPITAIDLKSARIPDAYSLGGLACLSLHDALLSPSSLLGDCLAAALAFALFLGIRAFTKGLGFGDLKYAALIAFYTGFPYCFAAMATAATAAMLFFVAAVAFFGKRRTMMIPFAPFLTIGALVAAAIKIAYGGGSCGL
jgi:prepilin signal peptidase PulO-like enzyme (type II secretory pathway)